MRLLTLALAALLAAPAAGGDEPPARADAPKLAPSRIILVGDSTVAANSGWGGEFCARHLKWSVACLNLARGGRSTRSFRSEGAWDLALAEMKVPGYDKTWVLIQMGHNDAARHEPERWTDEATEFPANLRRFVKEARAAGAIPVLLTPLARREFREGRLLNTLASWSDRVRAVAREQQVPLVDLNARSAERIQRIGAVAAMDYAQRPPSAEDRAAGARGTTLPPPPRPPAEAGQAGGARKAGARGDIRPRFDYTHLGPEGARVFAAMVAEDLAIAVPELAGRILPGE